MNLLAKLDSKVVDGSIVATITVKASGGMGHRRAMEMTFINTVNDNESLMDVKGDGAEFNVSVRCIEAVITPFFGSGHHVYKAEVSIRRNGTTVSTIVSSHVLVKPI